MKVEFNKDKETKNAIRFTASFGKEISGSLYVAKDSELAKGDVLSVEVMEREPAEA